MTPRSVRAQAGVSLVELMVGLALGLFVLAGITSVYLGSKQTYRTGDALARTQESLRVAMEYLSRDLRMAGAYGCVAADLRFESSNVCGQGNVQYGLRNTLPSAASYANDFAQDVEGSDTAVGGTVWSPLPDPSVSGASPAPRAGSDILTVRGPLMLGVTVDSHVSANADGSAELKAWLTNEIKAGETLVVADCETAAVFKVSAITPNPETENPLERKLRTITHTATDNACTQLGKDFPNGYLMRVATHAYFVATGAGGLPSLFRKEGTAAPVELVEGIENLQVQYGRDTDDDGAANDYVTAATIGAAAPPDEEWDKVVSVRVDMLVASREENVTPEPQVYTFAGSTITPTDRRLRETASITVAIRNRE